MTTNHVYAALRGRLHHQIERNHWLLMKNRSLIVQVEELEAERRRVDSKLVRLIKRIERWLIKFNS